ncbi:MAG: HEPN domain-containing protein [Achromobacter mucicolens]
MTAEEYIAKAGRVLEEACVLLKAGGYEGACNRAYYAMFDAAHAALLVARVTVPEASPKTHRSVIALFGLHLVKAGAIQPEMGIALNKVERLRKLADYTGETVTAEDAEWAVQQATEFLRAVRERIVG